MTNFTPAPFQPPFWLSNPHLQTILPKFVAPSLPSYRRELVKDSLDESEIAYDFYDADEYSADEYSSDKYSSHQASDTQMTLADRSHPSQASPKAQRYQKPLVVLFHGMEGSSDSHYARALAEQTHEQGWHFVVVHFRSCGGVPVRGSVFYNAGDTDEVHHALSHLAQHYAHIHCMGVSLGGNALAKYMGEYAADALCDSAVVVSAPVDLASSSVAMERFLGRRVYTPYLLNPMIKKALNTNLSTDEVQALKATTRISDFDQLFTAPRHGYRSKNDYYRRASALPYLLDVAKPTLVITAKDDPFLGVTATSRDVSDEVQLLDTAHGGHIGFVRFMDKKLDVSWVPQTAIGFYRSLRAMP